jgi:enamine deaminase RidA (YjgF/YER057c/UK114 family)
LQPLDRLPVAGKASKAQKLAPNREVHVPDIKILNPDSLAKPLGQYSHITRVKASEFIFIAGQLSADKDGNIIGVDDFDAQCVQIFANIDAALKSCGAGWGNIVQFYTFMVHSQDIPKFMKFRLREFPKLFANGAYPPNTLLMIDRLVKEEFLIEVQVTAAL